MVRGCPSKVSHDIFTVMDVDSFLSWLEGDPFTVGVPKNGEHTEAAPCASCFLCRQEEDTQATVCLSCFQCRQEGTLAASCA